MIEIRVTNSEQAQHTLAREHISVDVIDTDIIECESNDWFDCLDILADEFLLLELVEFAE